MKYKLSLILLLLLTISVFAQDTLVFSKIYLPGENKSLVFIPAGYKEKTEFPLLYLLHGYSGSYKDWNNNINVQELADKYGFIIVCPEGYYNAWYLNSPIKKNNQYSKFFWNDLYPLVNSKYKVDKSNIFITGLSMGGHGSMLLYLPNQKKFKAAGSMSGILDIRLFYDKWEMKNLLGDYKKSKKIKKTWDNYSAVELLKKFGNKNTSLIVDCGTEDFAFKSNQDFNKAAKKQKVNIVYNTLPGNHNWEFWTHSVITQLDYFKQCTVNK
ncbi:MAG TPA: alpha/beta hydrolase-fold protein [Melioribacteraceae bacterium]|nr:alpha/beta hydrolase-fold protein [Melioribacteraceae bacterium]